MQALRQIVNVKDNLLHVILPAERFSGAIAKETAEKLNKHLNEARNEWKRNIY